VGFRNALRDFGVPAAIARPMVLLLPLLELAVAVTLIPAGLAWYGARGALALLIAFLIAVGIAMIRGRKPDCHCFGQLHTAPVGWQTLIRNGVLTACAGWLASRAPGQLGPDLWAPFATLEGNALKVAIIAACAAAVFFFALVARARPRPTPIESPPPPEEEPEEAPPAKRPAAAAAPIKHAPIKPGPMGIGLTIGTPAPGFELPALTGEKRSLEALRNQGRDVLLVFTSPFCMACEALASNLVRWIRETEGSPNVVLLSRGATKENRVKLKEFDASKVLLQPDFELAEAYDVASTPTAVLVGADGLIKSELSLGAAAIKQLLSASARPRQAVGSLFGPQ
jgi:peroxiredoxin